MIPFVREIGGFLRGNATPFQLFSGAFLAGIISFMPGFQQAPGLVAVTTLLLLVLNTNLMFAGITMGLGRLLALAIQPVTFGVGETLIDGPTSGLLTQLINGPVTAWFGFENYIATGGLVLGAGFGGIMGLVTAVVLGKFRSKMAALEAGSQAYKAAMDNKLIQGMGWLLFGGHKGEDDWGAMSKRKFGKPVRYVGIAAVVVVGGLLVASPHIVNESWLGKLVGAQLSRANGATVDIATIETDVAGGKLAVTSLAVTDPNDLERNLLQSLRLEADVSNQDLYRKKYALDRLEVSGAKIDSPREKAGSKVGPQVKPSDDPLSKDKKSGDKDGKGDGSKDGSKSGEEEDPNFSIDGVLEKADEWKANLAEVKKWLSKITGASDGSGTGSGSEEIPGETLEERLRRLAEELGYANVIASHRITDKPRFTIHELVMNDVEVGQLKGEVLNILGTDLSTEPHLLEGASTINVDSESGKLGLKLTIDRDSGPLKLHYNDLPVAEVKGWLKDSSAFPFEGGSFNIKGDGTLAGGEIYLPLQITPVGSQIKIPKLGMQPAPESAFTVVISGQLDNPRIRPDLSSFAGSLKQGVIDAGKNKVKEKLGDKLNGILGGDKDKEGEEGSEEKKGGLLDSILNR